MIFQFNNKQPNFITTAYLIRKLLAAFPANLIKIIRRSDSFYIKIDAAGGSS